MVKKSRQGADKLIDKVQQAADRLAEALDVALRGKPAAPALAPVHQPTAEELRRHARRRRGY